MSPPKKVLLLDTGKEWGGGTNSMIEFLKRFDRQAFAITCCFYADYRKGEAGRRLSEELADLGIEFILLPPLPQPLWAKLAKELARGLLAWSRPLKNAAVAAIEQRWRIRPRAAAIRALLADGAYDLLYMNNQPASNLEGYLAGAGLGLPVVQHCRIEPKLGTADARLVNAAAYRVICVSQGVADVLAAGGVDRQRLSVVYNAIDGRAPLPPAMSLPTGDGPVIGTVGQLTPRKGVADLLQAVAALAATGLRVRCLILGEGPQGKALRQLAQNLGIAGQVEFTGFQAQALAWVQSMDLCVLCSSKEGLPRVVLEAMLAGKAVVGSDVTGTRELVRHGESGLLYPHGDVAALSAALRQLLTDPDLRARFGQAGRIRVLAEFSIERYVASVSAILAEASA